MTPRKPQIGVSEVRAAGSDQPAPPTTRQAPTIDFMTDGLTVAHWHGIGIAVWARQATPELVRELERLPEVLGRTYSIGSQINIVLEGTPPPTSEGWRALKTLSERFEAVTACMATLIEGSGFRASTIRSLATALQFVLRRGFKIGTFGDIGSLTRWLLPIHRSVVGEDLDEVELAAVLSSLSDQQATIASSALMRSG